MKKIMIIGAHGATAQLVTARLLNETDDQLVLYLRHAERLAQVATNDRVTLVDGDVSDVAKLSQAMAGVDVVYSNVGGVDLGAQTAHMLTAMQQVGQTRLIFMSALGAHHEVTGKFGEWNEQAIHDFLPGFRDAAAQLVAAGIDYTEVRPAWLTDEPAVDYETTTLADGFKGTEVSRTSVADFIVKVINDPSRYQKASIGLNKPNTSGDKPSWF